MKRYLLYVIPAMALFFASCSPAPTEQASLGSETTNGVSVIFKDDWLEGTSAGGARLLLYEAEKVPGDSRYCDTVWADDSGRFVFVDIPPGFYNLFAYPQLSSDAALVQDIVLGTNTRGPQSDSARFEEPAVVTGTVLLDGVGWAGTQVYLRGTPYTTSCDLNGNFFFEAVAAGSYIVSVQPAWSNVKGPVSKSVVVESGDEQLVILEIDTQK